MIIVETLEQIKIFFLYWDKEPCVIFPIWSDLDKHPMNTDISFLYVRFVDQESDQGDVPMDFILPFNHNDCRKLNINLSHSTQKKKVFNKKGLLQTDLCIQNMYDYQTEEYFEKNEPYIINDKLEPLTNFYTRLGLSDNLGKSIPIMKWMELLRGITDDYFKPISWIEFSDSWVDGTLIPTLSQIEKRGFHVVRKNFIDRFPNAVKQLTVDDYGDKVYTEYNPYTITSRPSNRHGGVNYGALNKSDGTREIFIPREGTLFLQLDYDAYHVRIIADMIGYELPPTSAHQWLAEQYGCGYKESKGRTFKIIYGGVTDEDRKIEFFNQLDIYIQKWWVQTQMNGYILTPKGRKINLDWIEDITPQKAYNYLLQATETELNIDVIKSLYENGIENLCLYSYDAFLFEYGTNQTTCEAKRIKEILESNGFPVNASWGVNYSLV